MAAAQQQQGGGSSDNSLDFLWMIVLIIAGVALIWFFGREYIVAGVLKVRLYEIYLIEYVLRGYAFVASFLHLPMPSFHKLSEAVAVIQSKPTKMPLQDLISMSEDVGRYLMIPVMLIISGLAMITYFANITERFRRTYSMHTLRKSEHRIWPQINPVMKHNLVKTDLDDGAWASSLTPMLFAKKHHFLVEKKEDNGTVNVTVNEGAAHRVFALQTGQFWRDITTLPIHVQALFGIFLARANQDRKNADNLLTQIATSGVTDKLDFTGAKELAAKHNTTKTAKEVFKRHAYLLTVMATLLELARTDGVLATAEFIWLKPIDRPLWYMLNSVGRQTAFPEAAGAFAHWLAEKKLNRPLRVPMVEEAVKAIELALKEVLYEPEEVSS